MGADDRTRDLPGHRRGRRSGRPAESRGGPVGDRADQRPRGRGASCPSCRPVHVVAVPTADAPRCPVRAPPQRSVRGLPRRRRPRCGRGCPPRAGRRTTGHRGRRAPPARPCGARRRVPGRRRRSGRIRAGPVRACPGCPGYPGCPGCPGHHHRPAMPARCTARTAGPGCKRAGVRRRCRSPAGGGTRLAVRAADGARRTGDPRGGRPETPVPGVVEAGMAHSFCCPSRSPRPIRRSCHVAATIYADPLRGSQ